MPPYKTLIEFWYKGDAEANKFGQVIDLMFII